MKTVVLQVPVPAIATILLPQQDLPEMAGAPDWLMVFLLGAWVAITYLDKVGKLPGTSGSAVFGFTDDDRRRVREIHGLMTHRGPDGVERFIHRGQLLEELAKNGEVTKRNSEDFNRALGMTTDQLRSINQRLLTLEKGMKA